MLIAFYIFPRKNVPDVRMDHRTAACETDMPPTELRGPVSSKSETVIIFILFYFFHFVSSEFEAVIICLLLQFWLCFLRNVGFIILKLLYKIFKLGFSSNYKRILLAVIISLSGGQSFKVDKIRGPKHEWFIHHEYILILTHKKI